MRSRNTENSIIELANKTANYQQKRYVVMKFTHEEKHIVFSDIGKGRIRKKVLDGVHVTIALTSQI